MWLQPVLLSITIIIRTCFLKWAHSSGVMVSAFAMTGIMLTLSWRRCINSTSNGFKPWPEGATKYRQQCTRLSGICRLTTRLSAFRNSSYFDSIYSITGTQLKQEYPLHTCSLILHTTKVQFFLFGMYFEFCKLKNLLFIHLVLDYEIKNLIIGIQLREEEKETKISFLIL